MPSAGIFGKLIAMTYPDANRRCCQCGNPVTDDREADDDGNVACDPCLYGSEPAR